ncbi:MAG: dihydrodipicolinate synthase family protein [Sphaerochaetaceae bacterium]
MNKNFRGVFAIPPAVYYKNLEVDYEGVRNCVRFCLDCGAHGIVIPVWATEYYVLTEDERKKILEVTIKEVNGAVPVIAGVTASYVKVAVDLAQHAVSAGADGIIAAPPHLMKVTNEELYTYYKKINDAVTIPIMIQHLFPPLGTVMSIDFLMNLVKTLEHVEYIKEESLRTNQMISGLYKKEQEDGSGKLKGIMGGNGGRNLIEEYQRGICGTMPPSGFTDILVDIWNLLENGNLDAALDLHTQVLPVLTYGSTYPLISYKEVLKRRGIVDFAGCREAGWPVMDEISFKTLNTLMKRVEPLMRIKR